MAASFSRRIIAELKAKRARIARAIQILSGVNRGTSASGAAERQDRAHPPTQAKRRIPAAPRSWTEEQHAFLREWYGKKPDAEIAQKLNKSACAVKSRAGKLGLTKGTRPPWTPEEDARLRELYPHQSTPSLVPILGRTLAMLYRRAWLLGIEKTPEYLASFKEDSADRLRRVGVAGRFQKGIVPANKGLRRPGYAPGRMAETQFKKGQRVWNQYPIGAVVQNTDGYLRIKIADDPHAGLDSQSANWEFVHKRVWEDAHGPIPPGHRIWWKDGNHLNCALENLELLSDKEHMARTTIHNLPQPLKEVIQLKGSIRRLITMRSKKNAEKEQAGGPAGPSLRNAGSAEGRREAAGA